METAVNFSYEIPSSHTRASDCIELDFKLSNHTKHKDMLFSPINHNKPEKWLNVVEKLSNDLHQRTFPMPPSISLLSAQPDVTSSALNGLQVYSKKFHDMPPINGYDPKLVLDETEVLPMKRDLLTNNGRHFGSVFSASALLTVPAKKKKGRPKKQAVAVNLTDPPDTNVKSQTARASTISKIDELSNIAPTESKKNLFSKVKESKKSIEPNKSVSSDEPIINGMGACSNEKQSQIQCGEIPNQVSSTISPMSQFLKSDTKDDETALQSCKGSKKNSKSPAKRKAPKTIVRDSYKKSKHKSKSKRSRNCSVDSASQLRDQFFLDKRRSFEPPPLHGSSHGYLANEYMQQYISAELYEQYIKTGEPSFDASLWNKTIHYPGRGTNFENTYNCARTEGLSLRHDLEPGEILRLESDSASALQRNAAQFSSHPTKDNLVNSDLLYIYYSKFYETFHQLALQQSSKQETSAYAPLRTPTTAQVSSSIEESSTTSNDAGYLSKICNVDSNVQSNETCLGVQNGSLSASEKRKFPELQVSQLFDQGDQRRKRLCTDSANEQVVTASTSQSEGSINPKENLVEAAGENNDTSGVSHVSSPMTSALSTEAPNGLDACKTVAAVSAVDLISNAGETLIDSFSSVEDQKCEPTVSVMPNFVGSRSEAIAQQSVDPLFDTNERDCTPVSIDSEMPRQALDVEPQVVESDKSKESFSYIPLKKILDSFVDEPKKPEASDVPENETNNSEASVNVEANGSTGAESPEANLSSLANLQLNLTTKINIIKLLQALSSNSKQTEVPGESEPCMKLEGLTDSSDSKEEESENNKAENELPVESQCIRPILKVPTIDTVSLLVSSSKTNSESSQSGMNSQTNVNEHSDKLPSTIVNNVLDIANLTVQGTESTEDKPILTSETCLAAPSIGNAGTLFQSRLSSRSSSVCTDELFEKDDSDELQKQFDELALTAEEHEQVEKIEWSMWMERLAGTSLEFLVKDDPPKNSDDKDQDDIDEILKNVRETISVRKQQLEEKKLLEKEQALARCLEAQMKNESSATDDGGGKGNGSENPENDFTASDALTNSDILSELSKRGFLASSTPEDAEGSHLEENHENVDAGQPSNPCLQMPQTENKEELIVSTLGWAEPDDSRPLSSAHMLHWSYCRMTNHLLDPTRESFKCPLCSYKSPRKGHVERHILIHSGEKPYSCSECNYRSHTKDAMALHARVHSGHKKFVCCRCSYATNRKIYLERHLALHDDEFSSPCNKCSDKTLLKRRGARILENAIGNSAETSSIRGDFDGTVESDTDCEETSPLPSDELENNNNYTHLLANVKEEYDSSGLPDDFTLCGCQLFSTKSDRKKGRVYSADRPYPCSQCSYRATKKSLLDKHAKVHTGERPFPCPLCKYKASRKAHLLRHMRTHQKELE